MAKFWTGVRISSPPQWPFTRHFTVWCPPASPRGDVCGHLFAGEAQLAVRSTCTREAEGSTPSTGSVGAAPHSLALVAQRIAQRISTCLLYTSDAADE